MKDVFEAFAARVGDVNPVYLLAYVAFLGIVLTIVPLIREGLTGDTGGEVFGYLGFAVVACVEMYTLLYAPGHWLTYGVWLVVGMTAWLLSLAVFRRRTVLISLLGGAFCATLLTGGRVHIMRNDGAHARFWTDLVQHTSEFLAALIVLVPLFLLVLGVRYFVLRGHAEETDELPDPPQGGANSHMT